MYVEGQILKRHLFIVERTGRGENKW